MKRSPEIQSSQNMYCFHLERLAYRRISTRGWLFFCAFLAGAVLAVILASMLWGTYTHSFTPYLKWQDALMALLYFIAFIAIGGSILVVRFLCALRAGYRKGMLTLVDNHALAVRDLSAENLISILWLMHSAFWCFVAVLIGLLPEMLLIWTLHLSNVVLVVFATGIVLILSLVGLAVSAVSGAFIVIGCIGAISFCRNMGAERVYKLSNQTVLRIDEFVLTIIYPNAPESMLDLRLLAADDQGQLLSLLHTCWTEAQQSWNPGLDKEIKEALTRTDRSMVSMVSV